MATVVRRAQEAAGLQPERGGRWRVEEVKDVRRREDTKAAWDVLVRWAGQHEDSWVARAALSWPLQKEVRSMLRQRNLRKQEATQARVRGVEARRAMRAAQGGEGRRAGGGAPEVGPCQGQPQERASTCGAGANGGGGAGGVRRGN